MKMPEKLRVEIIDFLKVKNYNFDENTSIELDDDFKNAIHRYRSIKDFGRNSPFNDAKNTENLEELVDAIKNGDAISICTLNGGCCDCPFGGILCT